MRREASSSVSSVGSPSVASLCASAEPKRAEATTAAIPARASRRSMRPSLIASAPLVRADEPVHADDVRLDALQQLPHRQAFGQIELLVEREQPEVIVMHAVTR